MSACVADEDYLSPRGLSVTRPPVKGVMVIGSCLVSGLAGLLTSHFGVERAEYCLFNYGAQLPDAPAGFAETYSFQMVQIAARSLIPDASYMALDGADVEGYARLFDAACDRVEAMLDAALVWTEATGVPAFVLNLLVPQKNAMGSFFDRYDLRNIVHFVERLNAYLHGAVRKRRNCYNLDQDAIACALGRRYIQDDSVLQYNHGAALHDHIFELDEARLDGFRNTSHFYPIRTFDFSCALLAEALAMYGTLRQHDQVKLVVVDIDDTLWRGVAAERPDETIEAEHVEGWPLGMVEALGYVRRRGILLALLSKNIEETVRRLWGKVYQQRLPLEHFAVLKINWEAKPQNMQEILRETNLLPGGALYFDDNPVERAAMKQAFPEMRVFGEDPLLWRRWLLWAPETQVAEITAESAQRTQMVQAQIEREASRSRFSRQEFLADLALRLEFEIVASTEAPAFARALELVNKSNQFNTTGKRWTAAEFLALFNAGGYLLVASARDRYTAYGRIMVTIVEGARIRQFVMSCRVVGMEVEIASVRRATNLMLGDGHRLAFAELVETPSNLLARDLYARCGFVAADGGFALPLAGPVSYPPHIEIVALEAASAA